MRHLNFLEIGTSDFDTCIQGCPEDHTGISVEPLGYYLDKLPNKPNVEKVNAAIALDNIERQSVIYYVHPDDIAARGLPDWLRGCNSIDAFHFQHNYLGIQPLVRKDTIPQIPIGKLLTERNVSSIDLLKIDVEGGDCRIMEHFANYIKETDKPVSFYPKKIIFEYNGLTDKAHLFQIIRRYATLGYSIGGRYGDELHLYLT